MPNITAYLGRFNPFEQSYIVKLHRFPKCKKGWNIQKTWWNQLKPPNLDCCHLWCWSVVNVAVEKTVDFCWSFRNLSLQTPGAKLPSPDLRTPPWLFGWNFFTAAAKKKHQYWGTSFLGGTPKTHFFLGWNEMWERKQYFWYFWTCNW